MALEGNLKEFNLADILQLLFFQKKTGVLSLVGRTDRVRILFHDGNIVGADSRKRDLSSRLGRMLVGQDIISETDLQEAIGKQKDERQKLGSVLVAAGLTTVEKIKELVSFQITETLVQVFSWTEGRYEFKPQAIPIDRDIPIVVNTEHFLMEGLRFVDEWSTIRDRISVDSVYTINMGFRGEMTEEEQHVYSFVNGVNDVAMISDYTGLDSFQVSTLMLQLLDKGAIAVPGDETTVVEVKQAWAIPGLSYILGAIFLMALAISLGVVAMFARGDLKSFHASGQVDTQRLGLEGVYYSEGGWPEKHAMDPWGNPLVYEVREGALVLKSAGPDGKPDTQDDIR